MSAAPHNRRLSFALLWTTAALSTASFGCGSDTPTGGSGTGQTGQRGDPLSGKVSCGAASCDVTRGEKCCLWLEGNPIVQKGACMPDCGAAPAQSGTSVDERTCDGAEDCGGSACCDGRCSTEMHCLPGVGELCHETKECTTNRSCCTELLVGVARYGDCNAAPQTGCTWP